MTNNAILEERIGRWRQYLQRRQAVRSVDVEELEDHLRSQIDALREAGLDEDEAFLVAVKRLGGLDALSREFAIEYSERLWKQLVVSSGSDVSSPADRRDAAWAVGLALAAAVAIKIPELFGLRISGPSSHASFYLRNLSLFVLPFLAGFFALKRSSPPPRMVLACRSIRGGGADREHVAVQTRRSYGDACRDPPSDRAVADGELRLRRGPVAPP